MGNLRNAAVKNVGNTLGKVFPVKPWNEGYQPRSILVVKTCCLGDVLMATPTLRALREAFPQSRITMMVGSWSKEAVIGNPNIDAILDCGSFGSGRFSLADYWSLIRRVRKQRFDCCFVLERSVLAASLVWLAGIPVRVGLDSAGRGFALTNRLPCPERRHEAELYLDVVRAAGLAPENPHLEFSPSARDRAKAQALLGAATARPLVAIHPGGGVNPGMTLVSKRWPAQGFAAIADLLDGAGYDVLLVGSAGDRQLAEKVKSVAGTEVLDLVGCCGLGELAAVFERCRLVIGNDTGPIHLAVAVGTPVVAAFGPSDPLMYGPYRQADAVACLGLSCSPCFRSGQAPACQESRCMTDLGVDMVWDVVARRLSEPYAPISRESDGNTIALAEG